MAAGTFKAYGVLPMPAFDKEIDFLSDTIKALLTSSSHTPNQDVNTGGTGAYHSDLSNEVSGTGYTTGGQAITGKSDAYTSGSNTIKWVCDDIIWTTVTISDVKNIHLYDSTPGSSSTNPLLCYAVIDAVLSPSAGNLTFDVDSGNGFLQFISS